MATTMIPDRSERLRSAGLAWLNGGMAILCAASALVPVLMAAALLFLQVAQATHWPPGGLHLSHPWLQADIRYGTETVGRACPPASPGATPCRPWSETHPAPAPRLVDDLTMFAGFLPLLLPLLALAWGLAHAALCFRALAQRRWFARSTITHLRDFALGGLVFLALWPGATDLARTVATALDRAFNPQATVHASFVFNANLGPLPPFLTVIYAVALAVITAVLAHARKVAEDHAQIV